MARPRVSIILCRNKLLDRDNSWASVKAIVDGASEAGLIPGDAEDQIELEVKQEKVAHRKEQRTILEIDYGN